MAEYLMLIPPDKAEQTRKFFRERGGCVLWKNQDLSNMDRPSIMTPATHEDGSKASPPHWAYAHQEPQPLKPSDIGITDKIPIELPLDWFPVCDRCNGVGRLQVEEVAAVRNETVTECRDFLIKNNADRPAHLDLRDDDTFRCWQCDGTGHIDRRIRSRVKRTFWNSWQLVSDKKAKATVAKLTKLGHKNVEFDWEWSGHGDATVNLVFFTETITPFTME